MIIGEIKSIICEKIPQKSKRYSIPVADSLLEDNKNEGKNCSNEKEYYNLIVLEQ